MKRKIIRQGHNTLTITLPREWCEQKNLRGGDEVDIGIYDDAIHINTQAKQVHKQTSVDISQLDRCSILYTIRNLYRIGYDELELTFKNHSTPYYRIGKEVEVHDVIRHEVNNLVGYEIIDHSANRVVVKDISSANHENFENILRRIFYMLKECSIELDEGIKTKNIRQIKSLHEKHDVITKFVSYCLRLLNKTDTTPGQKREVLYHVIASLDKIADGFKHISRNLQEKPNAKDIAAYASKITKTLEIYARYFYKHSTSDMAQINQIRDTFKKEMSKDVQRLKNHEIMALQEMGQILEIIADLTVARMGLDFEQVKQK